MKRINYNILNLINANKLKELSVLLDDNNLVNCTTPDCWTPLLEAITLGNLNVVKLLINKGANINHKDEFGNTALMHLSAMNADNFSARLKGSLLYWGLTFGIIILSAIVTLLFIPILYTSIFYVSTLSAYYIIFFYSNSYRTTLSSLIPLLLCSILIGSQYYIIAAIILLMLLISLKFKNMLLRQKINNSYKDIASILLEKGANIDIKNIYNEKAIDIAVKNNNIIIKKLIQR